MPKKTKSCPTVPPTLKPEMVSIIVDTREKTPWDLSPLKMITRTLDCGDYALQCLPNVMRIERKSLSDLLGCVGRHRDRFEREMTRMLAYPSRMLIIESDWRTIVGGAYEFSDLKPSQVVGSLDAWQAKGINVVLAGDRSQAQEYAGRILFAAAKRHWKRLRRMAQFLNGVDA